MWLDTLSDKLRSVSSFGRLVICYSMWSAAYVILGATRSGREIGPFTGTPNHQTLPEDNFPTGPRLKGLNCSRGSGVAADTLVIGVTDSKSMDPSRGPWHRQLDLGCDADPFCFKAWTWPPGHGSNPQHTAQTQQTC